MSAIDCDENAPLPRPEQAAGSFATHSKRVVRLGMLGCGRVGQAVIGLAGLDEGLLRTAGFRATCVRALVRDLERPRALPVPDAILTTSGDDVLQAGIDVLIDVMGGVEPARTLVARALDAGLPVVTANKTLMAHHGPALRALARDRGVALAFDAAVVAGVPFAGALGRRPHLASADRIAGIVNGTSHFVLSAMAGGLPLEAALADAVARGYAEPDVEADLSGRDAAEKLTVLLHLLGAEGTSVDDLVRSSLADVAPSDFAGASLLSGVIKPVAFASLGPAEAGSWIGPAFVCAEHPFASLSGVANAVVLSGARLGQVMFAGPGAGPEVTAAALLDDVAEVVLGAPARLTTRGTADASISQPPPAAWFVRVSRTEPLSAREAAAGITIAGVPIDRVIAHGGCVYLRTRRVSWPAIRQARDRLDQIGATVLALPVLSN